MRARLAGGRMTDRRPAEGRDKTPLRGADSDWYAEYVGHAYRSAVGRTLAAVDTRPPRVLKTDLWDETLGGVRDILGELERSQDNPQAALNNLISMMGTSEGKIDVAADKSDSLVGQICHKYETYKWFSVKGDIGGGLGGLGIGGLGGLGGLGGGLDLGGLLGGG